ncbi:thioredoxin domain-containing protein [Sulfurimonas sp.]|uniref:DsbA family protein n=1 Tax=Sulfurimonas sp. TaxID=2022749 RepID=UPI00262B08C9|nr:thioredoxin domain-containing protein [Sulfurimonas sp.]
MSLMWKLLATTLLLSSLAYAQSASDNVVDFLEDQFSSNERLKSVDVEVDSVVPIKEVKGWNAYIVDVKAVLKQRPKKIINQKMIWFSNGDVITKDLVDLKSGQNLLEVVKPQFKDAYYRPENLIYGNKDAAHKIVIFSDPLCPFCKGFVPGALQNLKKEPNKFAVYYYHFPLLRLHPASGTLVKAAVAAELQGVKDVILRLYTVKINPREKDVNKILAAFNKVEGTNITIADINSEAVKKQTKNDVDVARDLMVAGTPTVYLDGKIDNTKKKYLKVK